MSENEAQDFKISLLGRKIGIGDEFKLSGLEKILQKPDSSDLIHKIWEVFELHNDPFILNMVSSFVIFVTDQFFGLRFFEVLL